MNRELVRKTAEMLEDEFMGIFNQYQDEDIVNITVEQGDTTRFNKSYVEIYSWQNYQQLYSTGNCPSYTNIKTYCESVEDEYYQDYLDKGLSEDDAWDLAGEDAMEELYDEIMDMSLTVSFTNYEFEIKGIVNNLERILVKEEYIYDSEDTIDVEKTVNLIEKVISKNLNKI